jgi:predicted dehydrogenase
MSDSPVRVASIGMGWWSDVLADAIKRSDRIEIVTCYTRSEDKRRAFAQKYGCREAKSYDEILADDSIEAIINTTPNNVHLETTRAAAEAGKHVFVDKPIANTVADGLEMTRICKDAGVTLAVGYQRRRENHFRWIRSEIEAGHFGRLVQAEANISRDRLGQFDASSWRYTAEGMPGGVMLQIGIHYSDVLEMLMGPVQRVSAMLSQLVLPGDNPDVANLILEHESGAISNLTACYALFGGLRHLTRKGDGPKPVACEKNDTIREELEEFADCVQGKGTPEMDGARATRSLATIRAGVKSAREGRAVEVAEIMASGE